jgi:hypothetical protein
MEDRLERVTDLATGPGAIDLTGDVSDSSEQRLRSAILEMARERGPASSICPSDAARAVGDDEWRGLMDRAREVARDLARQGHVEITQKGAVLDPDADWRGPVRIRAV